MKGDSKSRIKQNYGYFFISFFLIFLLSFMVLFFVEKKMRESQIEALKTNELRVVKLQNEILGKEFSMILADLHYLHQAYETQLENAENHNVVAFNWTKFSAQKRMYDQIRYIDKTGDEKIRINLGENGSYSVKETELQNKKDRYYFYETINLKEDSVYISPLDLNVEKGAVELPYKPMIRFSTPLVNESGNHQGIIIVNYLAENILRSFREISKNSQGEIMLLNADAYWLSSDDQTNNWNFMFDDKKEKTFSILFPEEWRAISQDRGQIITENGLFTFEPVNLRHKMVFSDEQMQDQNVYLGDGQWYIVSQVKRDSENGYLFSDTILLLSLEVIKKNTFYFILMGIVSAIVGLLVYINRKTYTKIKYYSEYDPLTKLLNRRAGINKLNSLFPEDDRRHFLMSLCFLDINGLKQVNDTLGHKCGDELIISVSEVIKSVIREEDFAMRLGGDEFLIVFCGIKADTAESVWDRIIEQFSDINTNEDRPYLISVSHGIIDYENKEKSQVDDLINLADEKMYKEKEVIKANFDVLRRKT